MHLNSYKQHNYVHKRFIVQQMLVTNTLFGIDIAWKNASKHCYSHKEAVLYLDLLQKNDYFAGSINNYKIVCIQI